MQPAKVFNWYPNACTLTDCRAEDGPEIFHGHLRGVSREEIIASLPNKDIVDIFVTTYFSYRENVPSRPIPYKIRVLCSYIMQYFYTNPPFARRQVFPTSLLLLVLYTFSIKGSGWKSIQRRLCGSVFSTA
jgi:hypothetical protein